MSLSAIIYRMNSQANFFFFLIFCPHRDQPQPFSNSFPSPNLSFTNTPYTDSVSRMAHHNWEEWHKPEQCHNVFCFEVFPVISKLPIFHSIVFFYFRLLLRATHGIAHFDCFISVGIEFSATSNFSKYLFWMILSWKFFLHHCSLYKNMLNNSYFSSGP